MPKTIDFVVVNALNFCGSKHQMLGYLRIFLLHPPDTNIAFSCAVYVMGNGHAFKWEGGMTNMLISWLSAIKRKNLLTLLHLQNQARKYKYSQTSITRTPVSRLPWLTRTRFIVPTKLIR